jgi:septal ring factor EnvC (AmiA/AmiB activator)
MKILICIVLFASATIGFSQCTSNISSTDKIADVQNKLNCFASENAKLKQELAESQNENAKLKQQLTESQNAAGGLEVAALTPNLPSPGECTNNTKLSIAKRQGNLLAEGQGYIAFKSGKNAVMVICQSMVPAYLIVGGRSNEDAKSLKEQLLTEIFHQN